LIGSFMILGGLRRDNEKYSGAITNYVLPALHGMKRESVADGLTKTIKKYVKNDHGEKQSKEYGTRSLRKGGLTEMRANRNLSTQEEYVRSGHVAPDQNPNAEGYVETLAAMSAPGGKALAGYNDPHAPAYPMSFECLNLEKDVLDRFLSHLFVNDIECLKEGGKLRQMLVTCAATLVGWYNEFQRDMMCSTNSIVAAIRTAAQKSALSDASITPTAGAPMWLMTLKSWSQKIKDAFECNNPESVTEYASITEQYMGMSWQLNSLLTRVSKIESSITTMSRNSITEQTLAEANKALTEQLQKVTNELMKQNK
jgi:hypothetical protein